MTSTGLTDSGTPGYHAAYRVLRRPRRRLDALDCERGPMPDEEPAPEVEADGWLMAAVLTARDRAVSRIDSKGRPLARIAWDLPKLSHRTARAVGLSRERMRQVQRQTLYAIVDAVDHGWTDADRAALGTGPDWRSPLRPADHGAASYAWRERLTDALWAWRSDTARVER